MPTSNNPPRFALICEADTLQYGIADMRRPGAVAPVSHLVFRYAEGIGRTLDTYPSWRTVGILDPGRIRREALREALLVLKTINGVCFSRLSPPTDVIREDPQLRGRFVAQRSILPPRTMRAPDISSSVQMHALLLLEQLVRMRTLWTMPRLRDAIIRTDERSAHVPFSPNQYTRERLWSRTPRQALRQLGPIEGETPSIFGPEALAPARDLPRLWFTGDEELDGAPMLSIRSDLRFLNGIVVSGIERTMDERDLLGLRVEDSEPSADS